MMDISDDAPLTELNVGDNVDKKPAHLFSFKSHDTSSKSSIPSYSRGLVATQSQNLSENNVSERSIRRPPFFMSSQQQDSSQRSRTTDSQKSQLKLVARLNFPIKTEERPPIISRNFDAAPPQAHRTFFSGISRQPPRPPASEHQPSASLSVDQFVRPFPVKPADSSYTLPKPPARQEPAEAESTLTGSQSPNAPKFRILHQPDVPLSTPSRSRDLASPEHSFIKPTVSRSRSRSVVAYEGSGEEDISVMMMRGATEVRNVRAELEEQRREVAYLHSELEALSKEKEELSRRLDATKTAAKKGLETCSDRYNDLNSAFESLKGQSQASFAFVDEAKITLADLTVSQRKIIASIEDIQPRFGEYGKDSETKALIRELEEECLKTQQVGQLLREKLQNAGGDLAEAKNRIAELESLQLSEAQAFKESSSNMLHISEKFPKMVTAMKEKELETMNALRNAADAEMELNSAKERIAELSEVVAAQRVELESARQLEQQNVALKTELDDRVSRLIATESAQLEAATRLGQATEIMQEQQTQLRVLQASVTAHEERETELQVLSQAAESQAKAHHVAAQNLQEELRSTGIREHVALTKIAQSSEKMQILENELAALRKDLKMSEEISQEAKKRFSVLQERFDDQSVTLRITKELSGDVQERLLTSEAAFAAKLEAHSGKTSLEIALLKEQKLNLQTNLERIEDQAKESSKIARERLQITIGNFEKQLAQQDLHHTRLFQLEERRGNQMEAELVGAKNAAETLEQRLGVLGIELEEMKNRLEKHKGPSSSQVEEVASLKVQVSELECANKDLVQREKDIDVRYKQGDLSDEEKAFVNSLIQMSQSIHEQELVSKGNELRRRDNMIASLNTKIGALESTLARHLQAKAKADASSHNQSMIDLKSFMSSSPLTPVASGTAPLTTALPPVHCVNPQDIETPPTAATKPVAHDRASVRTPLLPVKFTRLATDTSDDMIESEDDIPLSEALASESALGKRDRLSSPGKVDDTARPSRRLRAVTKKPEPGASEHKRSESIVKPKTRKRR